MDLFRNKFPKTCPKGSLIKKFTETGLVIYKKKKTRKYAMKM